MAESKIKVQFGNQTVDAVEVKILEANESWNEYKLANGVTLRVKHTVASIAQIPGAKDPEGNPLYVVKGTTVAIPVGIPDAASF